MKTPVDDRFAEEARRFHLRLHCEDCVFHEVEAGGCANGFPTHEHRRRALVVGGEDVVFCKSFELA